MFILNVSEVKLVYKNRIKPEDRIKINGSQDSFRVLYDHWDKESMEYIEEFKGLLLNRANIILGIAWLFKGGAVGTGMDPIVVFQRALKANALQIIIAHNHPSGNLKPSEADISITRKIQQGRKQLETTIPDHIILTARIKRYCSFSEEGL